MTTFKGQMLWETVNRGDTSAVRGILNTGHINTEERDSNGSTFLMVASEKGYKAIVNELLQNGVDANAVDNENWSALLCASKEGHLDILLDLLDFNAEIEHADLCGWTALMWASYKGRLDVVNELLERNANPNVKADHNMTCLAWAAGRGHTDVTKALIDMGAKINIPDKYGTTPLIWASRKGHLDIVEALLEANANVDASGMNSWTPILVATRGGHFGVVRSLLAYDPNVNATDKDGLTSLAIAAKEGFSEIVNDLLLKGAYVNVVDRQGDTILIHAVKGGHVDIVRALLKKYADVNIQGQDGKTALYWAVEKGYTEIVKLLLEKSPDLEIRTKDEDTPLLRAVRMRNEECVKRLLDKGAKISASDKRGDTALHIAIRARAKKITELLLRNPRHSRLLYRLNKNGESPYSMDTSQTRAILPQIFGHGNLNAADAENRLGYEIYSSALADILSEPSLITPIIIGLYAKWGSGKSFLLDKLRDEMKSFTQQNREVEMYWSGLIILIVIFIISLIVEVLSLVYDWKASLFIGLGISLFLIGLKVLLIKINQNYDFRRLRRFGTFVARKQTLLVLFFKMLFCIPSTRQQPDVNDYSEMFSVRFLFSDCTRLTSLGGEKSLAYMIGTLCDAVEHEYGFLVSRLFRVFKPPQSRSSRLGFKTICCVPIFMIVIIVVVCIQVGVGLVVAKGVSRSLPVDIINLIFVIVVGLTIILNSVTWGQAVLALLFSQKRRVLRAADSIKRLKMAGFMQQLKIEVDLMSRLVNCMDSFTKGQTRLVVIVDGLDSCEQEKVLQVLDTVKSLFSDDGSPFITILAVDPHIIIKGIEQNLKSSFQDTNVNGFDYLRNVVHLPFYLQSQGMRIQQSEPAGHGDHAESPSKVNRQESLTIPNQGAKKTLMGSSHHIGGSLSSSIPGLVCASSFDLSGSFIKNDYFSDINPRSMRRLMNIVAVTARLLRAYNIDFKWHRLAAWINLTEQWPYRISWIIYCYEELEHVESSASLYTLYRRIVQNIPTTKDQDPLIEIDRNVRKLEASLNAKPSTFPRLNVGDLRKFLPCTINLDPYLRKLIRETQHSLERHQAEMSNLGGVFPHPPSSNNLIRETNVDRLNQFSSPARVPVNPAFTLHGLQPPYFGFNPNPAQAGYMTPWQAFNSLPPGNDIQAASATNPSDYFHNFSKDIVLSKCSVEDVCELMSDLKGLSLHLISEYHASIRENNISGLVLTMCDLNELQTVISMKFGDWQLFRSAVNSLIHAETRGVESQSRNNQSRNPAYSNQLSLSSSNYASPNNLKGRELQSQVSHESQDQDKPDFKLQDRKMRRNDSIAQQLSFETAFIRSAVSEFVEESEDDDEEYKTLHEVATIDVNDIKLEHFPGLEKELEKPARESQVEKTLATFTLAEEDSSSTQQSTDSDLTVYNCASEINLLTNTPYMSIKKNKKEKITVLNSKKTQDLPKSMGELGGLIQVLDGPEDFSPAGSGEFVPLLEHAQSLHSSLEFGISGQSSEFIVPTFPVKTSVLSPLAETFEVVAEMSPETQTLTQDVKDQELDYKNIPPTQTSASAINKTHFDCKDTYTERSPTVPRHFQEDFIGQSVNAVVEMSSLLSDSQENFHERLGVAFAQVEHADELETDAHSPDRETNV